MKRPGWKACAVYGGCVVVLVMVLMVLPVAAYTLMISVDPPNQYFQGGDYASPMVQFMENKDVCKQRCLNDARCMKLTWTDPHTLKNPEELGACWLKDASALGPFNYNAGDSGESWVKQEFAVLCLPPIADFSADKTSVDTQTLVSFTDLSTRADDWAWDFGDGYGSNHQDDEHQYSQAGTYTVTLTVTSAGTGGCPVEERTKVRSNYITVTLPVVKGSIYVQSSPVSATVYLDDALKSPLTPMTITDVTAGSHTIRLTKDGYDEKSQAVVVKDGQTATVTLTLTRSQSGSGLSVTTVPSGATVYVDGTVYGVTPLTNVQLTTGQHALKLMMTGYVDHSQTFTITAGQTTSLTLTLVPSTNPSGKGSLQISSTPSDAAIYIDGVLQGPTPKTISGLSAGSHAVRVTKTGYVDYSAPITVIGGQTLPLKLNLVPRTQPTGSTSPTTPSQPGGVGTIAVESSPPGANVYLDGKPSGTTPVTIPDVNAGSHALLLTMQGYSDASKSIDVAAGSQNQVSMDLHAGSTIPGFEAALAVLAIVGLVLSRRLHRRE